MAACPPSISGRARPAFSCRVGPGNDPNVSGTDLLGAPCTRRAIVLAGRFLWRGQNATQPGDFTVFSGQSFDRYDVILVAERSPVSNRTVFFGLMVWQGRSPISMKTGRWLRAGMPQGAGHPRPRGPDAGRGFGGTASGPGSSRRRPFRTCCSRSSDGVGNPPPSAGAAVGGDGRFGGGLVVCASAR